MSEPSKLVDLLTRSRELLIKAVEERPEHAPAILPAYVECSDLLERLTDETTIESNPHTGGDDRTPASPSD